MSDLYNILRVSKDADDSAIKKAYRKLARKYHPDVNKSEDAEDKFKEIQRAYSILSDPDKRRNYDQFGSTDDSRQGSNYGPNIEDTMREYSMHFDMDQRQSKPAYRIKVGLTLEEMYNGTQKDVKLILKEPCTACNGTGAMGGNVEKCTTCDGKGRIMHTSRSGNQTFSRITNCHTCLGNGYNFKHKCTPCSGTGIVENVKEMEVTIPRGIKHGQSLNINRPEYTVVLMILQYEHDLYQRDGESLARELRISLKEALLGTEKEIQLIDGSRIKLKIPLSTNHGTVQRIKGKGMPIIGGGYGDLFVKIVFNLPKLNSLQRKTIEDILGD